MTCTTMTSVPRESYLGSVVRWMKRSIQAIGLRVGQHAKKNEAKHLTMRMAALSPHLLRDIGLSDTNSVKKHR